MQLELSLEFLRYGDEAEKIRSELNKHLSVDQFQYVGHRSAEASSIIRLFGEFADWLPLYAAASIYLGRLAMHAADATKNSVASIFKKIEVEPLAHVSRTLAEAAKKVHPSSKIIVGISVLDNCCSAEISIRSTSPEEMAREIAALVLQAKNLSDVMQAEVQEGRGPMGSTIIEFQNDGSLKLRWTRRSDFGVQKFTIQKTVDD